MVPARGRTLRNGFIEKSWANSGRGTARKEMQIPISSEVYFGHENEEGDIAELGGNQRRFDGEPGAGHTVFGT
jgi:hypothetical protein